MQVEQKRVCTACGSESAPDASFCWRCLAPFAQVPPTPVIGIGRGTALPPAPVTAPGQPSAPGGASKITRVVVSLVAALGGYFGVQYLLGSHPSLPEQLAGAQRLSDAESKEFERYTAEEGERYGIDAEGGVYGSALGPQFFVILVDAAAIETTDELFGALITGFAQAGAEVDEQGATSGQRGKSEYRCISAEAGGGTAVACMWRDDGNVGIVLEAPGSLKGTRRLLWTVHDTVVS
jgi:hypothetical protein